MNKSICYSTNDENYDCDDLDALFDRLDSEGNLKVGQVYYEMDCSPITAAPFANAERLLDQWDEQLHDLVGESDESDFAVVTDEAKAELTALLTGWIDKHVSINRYWRVTGKRRERTVTQEDIDNE